MLHLYGENGLYELIELSKRYNGQIYDFGISEMINQNGFKNHRKYIEQILNRDSK